MTTLSLKALETYASQTGHYYVKKLIADGIADPKRICIAGSSYGGYAALAASWGAGELITAAQAALAFAQRLGPGSVVG